MDWKKDGEGKKGSENTGPGRCYVLCLLSFFRRPGEKERKREETRKNKNPLSMSTYGSAEAGGAPYSCTNLSTAGVMASELQCQWPSAPSCQLPHTHIINTLHHPFGHNHTAQREHINYRCTLNYFHYLPCSVDGTETGMMDGKGFVIPPQEANAPSSTFHNPFLYFAPFILHKCGLYFPFVPSFPS